MSDPHAASDIETGVRVPRLGFLGVGWIGKNRLEALVRNGRIRAAAIMDPAEEMVRRTREIVPDIAVVETYEDLLRQDLDGIVIATPSALHAEQTMAAFEARKAVFCQKPLGRSAAEVRRVVQAARESDRLLGVDLSYRFLSGARIMRDIIAAGEIGTVYAVSATFHNAYGPDKAWFYNPQMSGGGCLIDLGIHLVDLVMWLFDFPEVKNVCSRLFAGGAPLRNGSPQVEDYAFAHADLSTGAHLSLDCSWRLAAGCDAVIQVSLYGSKGGLSMRNVNGSFYDFITERFEGTSRQVLHQPPDDWGGRAAVDWAERLTRNNGYDPESENLVATAEILDRIYQRVAGERTCE
jgi:predicted dehydrogenase